MIGVCFEGNFLMIYLQALMQAIEHEIEVTVRVHEVRSEYERQTEEYVIYCCVFVSMA